MVERNDEDEMIRLAFRASGRVDIMRIAGSPLPRRVRPARAAADQHERSDAA